MVYWYFRKTIDKTTENAVSNFRMTSSGFVTVLFLLITELDKCQNNDIQVCSQNETFCADFDESTGRYTCRCATGYEASEPVCTPLKGFTQSTYLCIRIALQLKPCSHLTFAFAFASTSPSSLTLRQWKRKQKRTEWVLTHSLRQC